MMDAETLIRAAADQVMAGASEGGDIRSLAHAVLHRAALDAQHGDHTADRWLQGQDARQWARMAGYRANGEGQRG